ncbi:MAG: adenylate/guanylate cyclase domain-containing protein [Gammaproteobacteria bacterium]|nr:adenylate/guanylate cyclase domain-containing protein [Gammaproteobacteria bacterium]
MKDKEIEQLKIKLKKLEQLQKLSKDSDNTLEKAQLDKCPLNLAIDNMFEVLIEYTGARVALVYTFDETLKLHEFSSNKISFPVSIKEMQKQTEEDKFFHKQVDGKTIIAQKIDVVGESFGLSALAFNEVLDDEALEEAQLQLDAWTEELDNYLVSIARLRIKADVTRKLGEALSAPVLDEGIAKSIQLLQESINFDELLLVYRHELDTTDASLHFKRVHHGKLVENSEQYYENGMTIKVGDWARQLINGVSTEQLSGIGLNHFSEEILINDVRDKRIVGRVLVSNSQGEISTYDRDILERFGEYLRLRVVDFNREWKQLTSNFRASDVRRILNDPHYDKKYLSPKERDVAIMFCDISGFTHISEQILKEPPLIGKLIDTWGDEVVKIIWELNGVFDKMVGDCVIAFWGPPFYEMTPQQACENATKAAIKIREYTCSLIDGAILPELKGLEPAISVATGLNYCPVYIGCFGPDEDYTAFSSGMNNTARLQGVATRDQILCMDSFVNIYNDLSVFGEEQNIKVKNVAEPLLYRKLNQI